jgi:hypothetical protein
MAMSEPEIGLYAHQSSGDMKMPPVDVRGERTPSSVIFRSPASEKIWKPPLSVRNQVSVPAHEFVQAALRADDVVARPDGQMIRVRQLDLAADVLEVVRRESALDGRLSCRRS